MHSSPALAERSSGRTSHEMSQHSIWTESESFTFDISWPEGLIP